MDDDAISRLSAGVCFEREADAAVAADAAGAHDILTGVDEADDEADGSKRERL